MRDDIVLEGAIPSGGIVELLRSIEETCTTGALRYDSALEGEGVVALVRGQFAEEQTPDRQQRDPVEVLLTLREGRYSLQQRLPALPVTNGDHMVKSGSLAVHVPSELMRYCELAGLTGVLNLSRPPQAVTLAYERGALAEVRVGGAGGIEFQEVFGWEDGRFSVEAHHSKASVAEPPTTRTPRLADAADAEDAKDANDANDARDTDKGSERAVRSTTQDLGGQTEATFLRVVEMSLEDLLRERVERTPSARTGPVIPELPAVRPTQRPSVSTPLGSSSEPPRGESTVRVIYLAAERSPGDEDRRPAMDLNVPLPGEGTRAPSKPELPRNTAISALDDAGRLRQSKWPEAAARSSRDRDDEATTKFDTASHAALDLGRLPMMLAATEYLENAPMTESTPRPAESPKSSAKPGGDSSAQGVAPADASPLTTLKWVAFACLVLVACLGVLARLPGID